MNTKPHKIAIILPAYNEELAIAQTIEDFFSHRPDAYIHVINNNSTDQTEILARETLTRINARGGVHTVCRQGKGNAIRWAFRNIEADVYVMCDADTTYPASRIETLLGPIIAGNADMVVGDRLSGAGQSYTDATGRNFHSFGNNLVRNLINRLFDTQVSDILSGYRAFSRDFVKNFPILSEGFELETEMTLYALDRRFSIIEVSTPISPRPEGSFSKLHTYRDGFRVIRTILAIFRDYRPFQFFGGFAIMLAISGLLAGSLPIYEYFAHGYIYRVPTAILASGLMVLATLLFAIGLILQTLERHHRLMFERILISSPPPPLRLGKESSEEKNIRR